MRALSLGLIAGAIMGAGGLALGQSLSIGITGTNSENRNSIFWMGIIRVSRDESLTATPGGAQSNAVQTVYGMNRITTVATAGDSVKLPVCSGGKWVVVINATATNALNLYGQTGETINALAANTPFSLVAGKAVIAMCANDGNWYLNLGA